MDKGYSGAIMKILNIVNLFLLIVHFLSISFLESVSEVIKKRVKDDFSIEENRIRSYFCPPEMGNLPVSDWKNPTLNDYMVIQNHLRARLEKLVANPDSEKCFEEQLEGWIRYRIGRVQLIDIKNNHVPEFKIIYINNNPLKKDKCVICYGSYNNAGRDYIQGINCIIKALRASNFDGHFIYRIGGWPSLANGRLKYADVPYAFKPFFFEEVRDLGYKQILWLDSASVPVKNLDPIFRSIKEHGCCFFGEWAIAPQKIEWLNYVIRALRIPRKSQYLDIVSQVVGFDLENKKASLLLDRWIQAAIQKVPFLAPAGDQDSFMFLVHDLDLLHGKLPQHYYQHGKPLDFSVLPRTVILHNYDFLNPEANVPESLFR